MNVLIHLLQAPESLSFVLEAAGAVALERCGAIPFAFPEGPFVFPECSVVFPERSPPGKPRAAAA